MMPRQSLFTNVASRLAQLALPRRADLHIHTIASDGEYTPSQVVALARQANLAAIAITDHDTVAAVADASLAAAGEIEVIPGVEISAEFAGREVHLLGYFIDCGHAELIAALNRVCERRRERFHDFVAKLAAAEITLPEDRVRLIAESTPSLGRRHVATLLTGAGFARTRHEAFHRFLGPLAGTIPKLLIPVDEAIRLVREAGGVASLAHPHPEMTEAEFETLAGLGLKALEAEYPWGRHSPVARLRATAARLGLAISGGSDCHGPEPAHRRIGSRAISTDELCALRKRCGQPDCVAF